MITILVLVWVHADWGSLCFLLRYVGAGRLSWIISEANPSLHQTFEPHKMIPKNNDEFEDSVALTVPPQGHHC